MRKLFSIGLVLSTLLGAAVPGSLPAEQRGAPAPADAAFLREAAGEARLKIHLGSMAERQGGAAALRRFGNYMAGIHGILHAELTSMAGEWGISLPGVPEERHAGTIAWFSSLAGAELDRYYASITADDLRRDRERFAGIAAATCDSSLRAFAARILPLLKEQLGQAEDLLARLPRSGYIPPFYLPGS